METRNMSIMEQLVLHADLPFTNIGFVPGMIIHPVPDDWDPVIAFDQYPPVLHERGYGLGPKKNYI
jgi:hypothetical protein